MIKAIETQWKGYRFRSRLEARWAVFFERLGWRWEYEPQGFEKDGVKYLPDFQIHPTEELSYWVEVKGDPEWLKINKNNVDWMHDFDGILPDFSDNGDTEAIPNGLLLLGQVPAPEFGLLCVPVLGHQKGVNLYWRALCADCGLVEIDQVLKFHTDSNGVIFSIAAAPSEDLNFQPKIIRTPRGFPFIYEALSAARSARFEHGEAPAWS